MFIVWGSRATNTSVGYAADFCPICRSVRAFRIMRVGKSSHVYGISVGSGSLVGHNRECTKCGVLLGANPANYKEIVKRPGKQGIDELVQSTFPNIASHHGERLKLEAHLQHPDNLDPGLRVKLLAEPFQLMEHAVQTRFAKSNVDIPMVIIMIITVFLGVVISQQIGNIIKALPFLADYEGTLTLAIVVATFVVGGAALFKQGQRAGRQFMHKKIYPILTRALQPLKPNENEFRSVLAMLAQSNATMARKVSLLALMQSFGNSGDATSRVASGGKVMAQ